MFVQKINESYSLIEAPKEILEKIAMFLRVEKANAKYDRLIKLGFRDAYTYFTSLVDGKLLIENGHKFLLKGFGIEEDNELSGVSETEVDDFLKSVKLPFEPYDYQKRMIKIALMNNKKAFISSTSSGKSLSISLILEYFRRAKKRGVLIVPNINLLTQFKSDIESYGLTELLNEVQLLGNGNKSDFKTCLTITTWQSLMKFNVKELDFDFMLVDECQKLSGSVLNDIMLKSINTKIKLGFTGTLPEGQEEKMTILGLIGKPETIITPSELIERGLGTPININAVVLCYTQEHRNLFMDIPRDAYLKQLQFIKENENRMNVITKIAKSEISKNKNVLVLYQHTEHGESIFDSLGLDVSKAYDWEYQKANKVLFMNGSISGKIREEQRQFMEENTGVIMVANYSCMSTGVSIKNLHSLILASPMKSFVTISQSLGRLMRKHNSKESANIFDIVDSFGVRKPSGIFYNQYKHRLQSSYIPEDYKIKEIFINNI